ncbi:MAG: hypothetical protein IPM56_01770 [Ignavibacteriales bacterium]|nr:MAG: hypothetical protein IPM56_01770 [Ignavibacteriales bacterium]
MHRDLPTYEELLKIFSSEKLKPLRIITLALCLGVLAFFVVIMILYYTQYGSGADNSSTEMLEILLMVVMVATVTLLAILFLAGDRIFAGMVKVRKFTAADISNPESRSILSLITTFTIIRLAMFEGVSFFGLITLLLSVLGGVLDTKPVFWLSILPILFMFFYAFIIFPTSERVAQLVQDKIYPLIEE